MERDKLGGQDRKVCTDADFYEREAKRNFKSVSESSIRGLLKDSDYVWKMFRASRPLEDTLSTSIACVLYYHYFNRLPENSSAREYASPLVFAEETTFTSSQLSAQIWSRNIYHRAISIVM